MKPILVLSCIIVGIISAMPVIYLKYFYEKRDFKITSIFKLILFLGIIYTIMAGSEWLLIYDKIKIGDFYPIIKIIEIMTPIIASIFLFKEKYTFVNYIGWLFCLIAICLISY